MVPTPTIPRRLRRLLAGPVARAAVQPDANRYRKHFTAASHLWFLLWHGLSPSPSLRQSHSIAMGEPDLWPQLGLPPEGVSRSQLERSTHSRPLACFTTLLAQLRERVAAPPGDPIHLVDSSFVGLSAKLAPWSQHGQHAPGVRLHTGFDLGTAIPTHLHLTVANTHDITAWRDRDWADLAGWTVLLDLGYYSHADFQDLRAQRVSWICPLNAQARVEVTTDHIGPWPGTAAGDVILADQTITLGSATNRNGAVLAGLRLVTSRNQDGEEHRTLTDRFDLQADEVVTLYRQRWQIELFFRFLKHQLGVLRPLGYSRQAIELTVLVAVIVAILAVLLVDERPKHLTDIGWIRLLGRALERLILRGG